ncbi:hypothetical protein FNH05_02920 [Amycolatopsis rhizosphaerae]|uniref:Uncharacterized protein n=1 Tax=Amycolatopsis rhizosphaerae TaxID=2053003 RepID=A0A558DKE3_9PSEU|nr:hypothetical protein [Amycolatopsis rhizosphaerae]TVT61481.1 hypothetical protein FNH05_02920 [Amycolatopsis rhizosphaerae]
MRTTARQLFASGIIVALSAAAGLMVVRPALSEKEAGALADNYRFVAEPVNPGPPNARTPREVAPALGGIRSWISSVGAAAGLSDLRGLGRPADLCLVDPRDDSVTLLPARPSEKDGYAPVRLVPVGLPYDTTMAPMGCVPVDIDGNLDLLIGNYFPDAWRDAEGSHEARVEVRPGRSTILLGTDGTAEVR